MLPERHPFSYLSEAPGVQSPGTACTLPGTISPPLALRGTARVSCLRLLAHSLQDTPKGETNDECAWTTSLNCRGHSSCRNRQGYRFRTKTHPRTGGWAEKPETPCFPPSSSWEEYNAALRQPPRKLLGDQTLLLTIRKWDKSVSNPLEKSGVSTTRSETSTPKGLSFPWSQVRAGKVHLLSDQKASKQKWEFLWMTESWQVRYLLCWQDSASGFNNTKTTSNCVTYPLTLGRLWVPGSVLWASDIFWTNQTIARLTMDSNSFRFNIANLLHR